ncbi:hypothetical protein MKW98_030658 [Papaver atlanticum]|uniref:Uncharacterized protein n=1 Tax=Papaver atlanticum TaxID=357466 RepID=A0AAD4X2J9_9MAGN|nr:hypothetical protein MKW98_030658 [Papaver atlanticum]
MVLFEQFSIPSQRFNSGSGSTLPLPPNKTVSSASASMSQGGGRKRTVFSHITSLLLHLITSARRFTLAQDTWFRTEIHK